MTHEVRERVNDLLPSIREQAVECEELRRLPDSTAKALRESGVMRLMQPKRYGGFEADPRLFYECVIDIARADSSVGWVTGIVGVHPWQIALADDRLQAEIWGENEDTWVASTYMPGGVMTPVEGGYRLSGRWHWSSGTDHCDWVILGSVEQAEDGTMTRGRQPVLPRSDYTIEDTWYAMGLRGTGSNDIVVDDVFVPYHRTMGDEIHSGDAPGHAVNDSPLFKLTFASLFANVITAPVIGMAERVLEEGIDFFKSRVSAAHGSALEKDPYTIAMLAECAREISACRLLLMDDLRDIYETVCAGEALSLEQRARVRRNQVLNAKKAIAALDEVFDRAGAAVVWDTHPMQRVFRDAHTARHHTAHTPTEPALYGWTHIEMGLGPGEDPLT
jgi:3-hydroxy-9,10-secoandrosta-1,3,5(10)-triene-9,17-dione monooxygenase